MCLYLQCVKQSFFYYCKSCGQKRFSQRSFKVKEFHRNLVTLQQMKDFEKSVFFFLIRNFDLFPFKSISFIHLTPFATRVFYTNVNILSLFFSKQKTLPSLTAEMLSDRIRQIQIKKLLLIKYFWHLTRHVYVTPVSKCLKVLHA